MNTRVMNLGNTSMKNPSLKEQNKLCNICIFCISKLTHRIGLSKCEAQTIDNTKAKEW